MSILMPFAYCSIAMENIWFQPKSFLATQILKSLLLRFYSFPRNGGVSPKPKRLFFPLAMSKYKFFISEISPGIS
jgi:hypothetical protein